MRYRSSLTKLCKRIFQLLHFSTFLLYPSFTLLFLPLNRVLIDYFRIEVLWCLWDSNRFVLVSAQLLSVLVGIVWGVVRTQGRAVFKYASLLSGWADRGTLWTVLLWLLDQRIWCVSHVMIVHLCIAGWNWCVALRLYRLVTHLDWLKVCEIVH